MKDYTYDVAISFAGEQREYAKHLANKLNNCGINVFYDKWNPIDAWGKDLNEYLSQIYVDKAQYIIVLFSKEYINKHWTKFEFELIQKKRSDYILPIVMDDTLPDNWPSSRIYINSKDYSIDEIALMVRSRVLNLDNDYDYDTDELTECEAKIITITNEEGIAEECEIIVAFELTDVNREYVVYTKHDIDNNGYIELFVSHVAKEENGEAILEDVLEEDWPRVKAILRELASEDDDDSPTLRGVFKGLDGTEILS